MIPTNITNLIAIAEFVFVLLALVAGWIVLHTTISKTSIEIQERVRAALKDENELLTGKVTRLEKDNERMNGLMTLIIETLDKIGISLEIDNDTVLIKDKSGALTTARKPRQQANSKPPPTV